MSLEPLKVHRRPRRLLPVFLLTTILLGGGLGYRHWVSTPQYSLLQAKDAFEARDLGRFEKYVALDSCADSLTDDFMAEATRKMQGAPLASSPLGQIGQGAVQGIMALLKPTLSKAMTHAAREFVSTGQLSSLPGSGGKSPLDVGQIKDNLARRGVHFDGVGDVSENGDLATVDLRFADKSGARELPVQLEMRRVEGYWQVSKWKNAPAWMERELPHVP